MKSIAESSNHFQLNLASIRDDNAEFKRSIKFYLKANKWKARGKLRQGEKLLKARLFAQDVVNGFSISISSSSSKQSFRPLSTFSRLLFRMNNKKAPLSLLHSCQSLSATSPNFSWNFKRQHVLFAPFSFPQILGRYATSQLFKTTPLEKVSRCDDTCRVDSRPRHHMSTDSGMVIYGLVCPIFGFPSRKTFADPEVSAETSSIWRSLNVAL